jgi:hypothetical protein
MNTVLFWMVALELGAVAACISAVAKLEIRRHSSRRRTMVPLTSASSLPLATSMELRFPGQKKMRGYDYPELCSKDMSDRLLKVHRILTRDLQMH